MDLKTIVEMIKILFAIILRYLMSIKKDEFVNDNWRIIVVSISLVT